MSVVRSILTSSQGGAYQLNGVVRDELGRSSTVRASVREVLKRAKPQDLAEVVVP